MPVCRQSMSNLFQEAGPHETWLIMRQDTQLNKLKNLFYVEDTYTIFTTDDHSRKHLLKKLWKVDFFPWRKKIFSIRIEVLIHYYQ